MSHSDSQCVTHGFNLKPKTLGPNIQRKETTFGHNSISFRARPPLDTLLVISSHGKERKSNSKTNKASSWRAKSSRDNKDSAALGAHAKHVNSTVTNDTSDEEEDDDDFIANSTDSEEDEEDIGHSTHDDDEDEYEDVVMNTSEDRSRNKKKPPKAPSQKTVSGISSCSPKKQIQTLKVENVKIASKSQSIVDFSGDDSDDSAASGQPISKPSADPDHKKSSNASDRPTKLDFSNARYVSFKIKGTGGARLENNFLVEREGRAVSKFSGYLPLNSSAVIAQHRV